MEWKECFIFLTFLLDCFFSHTFHLLLLASLLFLQATVAAKFRGHPILRICLVHPHTTTAQLQEVIDSLVG